MGGEARVGERIFVRAIERGVVGQSGEPLERAYICSGVPSNSRPQPIANKVSPTKAIAVVVEDQRDVAERVAGNFDHPADMLAEAELVAFRQRDVAAGNVFGGRARRCARRSLP